MAPVAEDCAGEDRLAELGATLKSKLEATVLLDTLKDHEEVLKPRPSPLFALTSLNESCAGSLEVPWSQLLDLGLRPAEGKSLMTVGRHKDCTLRLQDPRASQLHFEVSVHRTADVSRGLGAPYRCQIQDWSSNGTFLNGVAVGRGSKADLASGDEIAVLKADRVGFEQRITFVFRSSTEVLAVSRQEGAKLDLDEHVNCPICMQALYKCVAVLPCFHNFCMACCSEWLAAHDACPVCRQEIVAVVRNHPMDEVVEAVLEAAPSLRRSKEEQEDLDAKDRMRLRVGARLVHVKPPQAPAPEAPLPQRERSGQPRRPTDGRRSDSASRHPGLSELTTPDNRPLLSSPAAHAGPRWRVEDGATSYELPLNGAPVEQQPSAPAGQRTSTSGGSIACVVQ